jgi:hypothetical protein
MPKEPSVVKKTVKNLCVFCKENPVLVVPFLFVLFVDLVALFTLYFSPRPPISIIMAPPIRRFWGDQFLHYPMNFLLLPKLFNYSNIVLSTTIGVLMTGILLKWYDILSFSSKRIYFSRDFLVSLKIALKRYLPMVVFFIILYGLTIAFQKYSLKFIMPLLPATTWGKVGYIGLLFMANVVLQSFFAFVFPALIISKVSLFKAFKNNFMLVLKHLNVVFLFVFIPSLLHVFVIVIKYLLPQLMKIFEPEVMLVVLSLSIVVTTIVDFFITSFCGLLYIEYKSEVEK